ncbi:MAG: phosphate acyltransferase, partial [Candidatus Puniceispirillaceae bacterium]
AQAEQLGWSLHDEMIIDAKGEAGAAETAAEYLRQDIAGAGQIGAVMKGQLHTDIFMGALLDKTVGVRTGNRLVHIFAIFPPDGGLPVMVSDAAVNVSPDLKTKAQSLIQMTMMGKALGISRPKLAVLSATETPIASMPASLEAEEMALWGKANIDDADIEGPLSFDLALSSASVKIKGITDSLVAGQAHGLLVPEIVSGNILYKALVYVGGGCAAGVVLGGSLPILLTSRADPPQARLASIALATVMASQ